MNMMINARCLAGKRTGVGRYLANLLDIWSANNSGNNYDLYFRNGISDDDFLDRDGVSSIVVPNSKIFDLGPVWEDIYLPRALNKDKDADVYFSPTYTLPMHPLKCKKVVTIFDISYIAHPEWFPFKNRISLQLLTGSTVKKADVILTGSEATKQEILKYYNVDENKIFVTNLGVDKELLSLNECDPSQHIKNVKDKYKLNGKVILFIGLVMNRRNIPTLMKSVANVIKKTGEKVTLVIIGKNHSFPYFDVMEEAEKHNISSSLRWITYTTNEEIFSFYKAADVFVCSSLYEGFNIPPLEAMSLGVPVICSNLSSLPEVVGDAAYLLDDPRDLEEMTTAIEAVLFDDKLQKTLIQKGKDRADIFSWDKCSTETMKIIENIK